MEVRYHTCGHCIRVRTSPHHWDVSPVFFDGLAELSAHPITNCPHCGTPLMLAALHPHPLGVAATVESWAEIWPTLQQRIEAQLAEVARHDSAFYPYHAEQTLTDFATALQRVVELTAHLEHHAQVEGSER